MTFIKQIIDNSTKFLIFLLLSIIYISSSNAKLFKHYPKGKIQLTKSKTITTYLAITYRLQTRGLSSVQDEDFSENEGMLFVYQSSAKRQFWMPDTYFDLAIIFLDKDFKILAIDDKARAHPGRKNNPPIYRTKEIKAQYVLEIKKTTLNKLKGELKVGDQLKWVSSPSLEKIISKTHLLQ